jgi:hypothetical protein
MSHVVCHCLTLFPYFSTPPLSPSIQLSSYNPGEMQIEHIEDVSEGIMTSEYRGQLPTIRTPLRAAQEAGENMSDDGDDEKAMRNQLRDPLIFHGVYAPSTLAISRSRSASTLVWPKSLITTSTSSDAIFTLRKRIYVIQGRHVRLQYFPGTERFANRLLLLARLPQRRVNAASTTHTASAAHTPLKAVPTAAHLWQSSAGLA